MGSDKFDDAGWVEENVDDVGGAAELTDRPLVGVIEPDSPPDFFGKHDEGEDFGAEALQLVAATT